MATISVCFTLCPSTLQLLTPTSLTTVREVILLIPSTDKQTESQLVNGPYGFSTALESIHQQIRFKVPLRQMPTASQELWAE